MKPRLVLGIGSPFGADRLGWDVVARLGSQLLAGRTMAGDLDLQSADRPGLALVTLMEGREQVILVDAVVSDAKPGTLHRIDTARLFGYERPISSHSLGIREALALGRTLGSLPPRVELFGLEVEPGTPADPRAVDFLAKRIAEHLGLC